MNRQQTVATVCLTVGSAAVVALYAPSSAVAGGSTIARRTGGVTIELRHLADYLDAPLDELRVYRWDDGASGWEYAPYQIDERIEHGRRYVSRENWAIDEDDELVALARHLGGRASPYDWPEAADDTTVRYDLRVTDPLDEDAEGWLHVFHSTKAPQPVPTMVSYDDAAGELKGTDYRLVQARTFPGLETLELFDSQVDILDRTKLRGHVYVEIAPFIGPIPLPTQIFEADYTEESDEVQEAAGDFNFYPVKEGPVRIVLEPDGSGFAYPGQVQLFEAFGRVDLPEIPPEIERFIKRLEVEFRVSVDFSAAALTGRYSDSNKPEGVPIDGVPESIPERPISNWRQIDTPYGGIVMVVGRPAALRALRTYYNDSGRDRPPGTGDNKAYGENGVFTEDIDAVDRVTDFLGWLVVVPPGSPVAGPRIEQEVNNPVEVEAIRVERQFLATPTATDTVTPVPTVTHTLTPTAPPTPSPTSLPSPTPSGWWAYLPLVHRNVCFRKPAPMDLVLVIDTSSSMTAPTRPGGPRKLESATEAAGRFVALLDFSSARAAVVAFDASARVASGGLTADRDALVRALGALVTHQGTRIDLGLDAAADLLVGVADPKRERVIVLLSDGGGDVRAVDVADRLRAVGVRIFTIGVGEDVDAGLLRAVATTSDHYYFSPDAADVTAIFEAIGTVIVCPP